MQRVMIVGQPGSGKSTLARRLGQLTGLPVVHIDTIHWQPGWIERSRDEKTQLCLDVEARDCWIFEGGHSATWGNRMARADLLIWIDRSATLRFLRVLRRTLLQRGQSRPDLPHNCPELLANLPGFLDSCGRRKDQRAQKCSNSPQLRHQRAAWFICGLIGTLGFFSRALEIRLARLRGTDRGTVRFFVRRPVLFRPKKPPSVASNATFAWI